MPLDVPTTTTSEMSFGPAVVFIGVIGATPSTELGALKTDDAVTIELTSEKRDIFQGIPKLIEYTYVQAQGAMLKFTGIQWSFLTMLYRSLGSGQTTSTASALKVQWGGDPLVTQSAIHVRHVMPISGDTLNVYGWKCVPENPPQLAFSHDEHSFELAFKCQRATADWAGTALAYNEQLIGIHQIL